ncbi:MAG: hypothetical protein ACE37M_15025 [Henriciella sp.]
MNIKQIALTVAFWGFAILCLIVVNMIHNHPEALSDMGIFQPAGDVAQSLVNETGKWTATFIIFATVGILFVVSHIIFEAEKGE